MNKQDVLVIIQGPANIPKNLEAWFGYNFIFSGWEVEIDKYGYLPFLPNRYPKSNGPGNVLLQKTTTLAGLEYAQKIGYEYSLKIRSDLFPTNPDTLFSSFTDGLNFIAKHRDSIDGHNGYLVDYMQFGRTDDLVTLWSGVESSSSVAEICLLNSFLKNFTEKDCSFILDKLDSSNDLWWERSKIFISQYKTDNWYRTYW
jgi:hypothetical protein